MAISRLSQNTLQNAFSKYNNIWDGRSAVGAMDSLGAYTFTTDSSTTVTFSNIPQNFTDLVLVCNGKVGSTDNPVRVQFNGDTSSIYSATEMRGNGTTKGSTYTANNSSL